jgi:histidinol phosphatase-like enzyme
MPKYDLGIFVITNQSGDDTAHAMEQAIDTLVERIAAREAIAGVPTSAPPSPGTNP